MFTTYIINYIVQINIICDLKRERTFKPNTRTILLINYGGKILGCFPMEWVAYKMKAYGGINRFVFQSKKDQPLYDSEQNTY